MSFVREVTVSTSPRRASRLPLGAAVLAGVLLLIPCLALALVPTYSRETPRLWGWPFFYWYQVLWVPLSVLFTVIAYRATGGRRRS
jgi:Protein of unknown function (DUF3311)